MTRTRVAMVAAAVWLAAIQAGSVQVTPTETEIQDAVLRGVTLKDSPQKLFTGYDFGTPGTEVNGYVNTKLLQISFRAARWAQEGKTIEKTSFSDILSQPYLLIPLYLVGSTPKDFEPLKVELRQGIRTIPAAEILTDPVEEAACQAGECLYKQEIYPAFFYRDFDPQKTSVLIVTYGAVKKEFPLVLSKTR